MEAKWTVCGKRADFKAIGEKFHIDQVVARVIRNRDVVGEDAIERYLNGTLSDVHSPASMADMEKGCELMHRKIKEGKKIRIISDYDVDGIMSNYILLDGLKKAGADVSYEIPDRISDGYGINERIILAAHEDGIDTIITCDNGIAAFSAISLAKEKGMSVIVTDHHDIPYEMDADGKKNYCLVEADAVIDHKRGDCSYPFKGLCGAGVAYKFIRCLYDKMGIFWEDEKRYIEMVALATLCDVMELVDENRIYVKEGLRILPETKNPGLQALLYVNQLKGKKLSSYHLGFVLGPCINATGRLESAKEGLALLLCDDEAEAMKQAEKLREINSKRKAMTEQGVEEAIALVEQEYSKDTILVVYMPDLHESLAGIVAGRLREKYYKPVFVITKNKTGILKGSGRSIQGYHMFDALTDCKELLLHFGGHELAAGFSLAEENLDLFRKSLNEKQRLTEEELTPVIQLDVPMPISYITIPLVEQLAKLEPFGKGNEKPLFGQANLGIRRAHPVGAEGKYMKIIFQDQDGYTIEGIDFDAKKFTECIKKWFSDEECDRMLKGLSNSICLDVAYYPDVNEFGGRTTVQIKPVTYKKA